MIKIKKENKRIVWIDQLRAIAFYFVVLGHMVIPEKMELWIYSFHMPLFFIISGLNLNFEKLSNTKFKDYISHLASRMLVPYLWLQFFAYGLKYLKFFIEKGFEIKLIGYLKGIFTGNNFLISAPSNPLYFVLMLFTAQLVFFGLAKLAKGNKWIILAAVVPLASISFFTENRHAPWHLNVVPTAILFMFIGKLLMDGYKVISEKLSGLKKHYYITIILVLFLSGGILGILNGRVSIHGNLFGHSYTVSVISAVLTSVAFALAVMLLPPIKPLTFIGMNTIFLLGIHEPFMLIMKMLSGNLWNSFPYVMVSSVVFYLLPVPAVWLFGKLTPYVCGTPVKENTTLIKAGKFVAVSLALAAPYIKCTKVLFDGFFRQSPTTKIVAVVIFAVLVVAVERAYSLIFPVFFLQKRKKENPPVEINASDEDGIPVIIPTEEK